MVYIPMSGDSWIGILQHCKSIDKEITKNITNEISLQIKQVKKQVL
jgi:hypothetical protein